MAKFCLKWGASRCLSITKSLLQRVKKSAQIPEVEGLVESVILPNVQSEFPLLRLSAVECLGLHCTLSVERGRVHLPLFIALLMHDEEEIPVRLLALRATFDLIMIFGARRLEYSEGDEELMFLLLQQLDSDERQIRLVSAEGKQFP